MDSEDSLYEDQWKQTESVAKTLLRWDNNTNKQTWAAAGNKLTWVSNAAFILETLGSLLLLLTDSVKSDVTDAWRHQSLLASGQQTLS